MSESGTSPTKRKPRKLLRSVDGGGHSRNTSGVLNVSTYSEDEQALRDEATDTFDQSESKLPPLPVDENSFLNNEAESFMQEIDAPRHATVESEGDGTLDEYEMRRHLWDMESSFLPETLPQQDEKVGADDTYLELGRPGMSPPPDEVFASIEERGEAEGGLAGQHYNSPDTPAEAYKTPAPGRKVAEEDEYEYETAEQHQLQPHEDSPSSPAAAAADRTHNRAASTASVRRITPGRANSVDIRSGQQSQSNTPSSSVPTTPQLSPQRPGSRASTVRPTSSPSAKDVALPSSESISTFGLTSAPSISPSALQKRPSYLANRQASQRSSASSATLASDLSGSDITIDADYALQIGGAIPGNASLRSNGSRNLLSRLPSLGSVASYISREESRETIPSFDGEVGDKSILASRFGSRIPDRLHEEHGQSSSPPATPRPTTSNSIAPTDTVIAQHVQSIQVPDTVAQEFRARHHANSPDKRPGSSGQQAAGLPRRTLTLKEQNGKIDKLTKENFDLKLKIHFLDQALQSRSDDGVKGMIDKNVQLQTDLANERKDTTALRRKVRELERNMKEQEAILAEARRNSAESAEKKDDDDPDAQMEFQEEILFLREQLEHSETHITRLQEEIMAKEVEKRKMAEHVRAISDRPGSEPNAGMKETIDMWQDLLSAESGRREQAEEDIRKLREEVIQLRSERSTVPQSNHSVKNFINVTKRNRFSYTQSNSGDSEYTNGHTAERSSSSATLVDQLKHENAELRRDLGAQTSMLTSRNRERERLQQEVEDLKLVQRKSDGARSLAGDSIFERSISRTHNHQRSASRQSDQTGVSQVTEAEREDWERKEGQLRDQNAELRIKFQELERLHNTYLQYVQTIEGDYQQMEQQIEEATEDLQALQTERDEALHAFEEKESDYEKLEQEALQEIEKLEKELQGTQKEHQKAFDKLQRKTGDVQSLQQQIREITQSVLGLQDEKEAHIRQIGTQEQQLNDAEDEIRAFEQRCKELDQKNKKLEITQESLHGEISFLREEQEGDKVKIGELEDALNAAQQTIQDEQEKLRELEDAIMEERRQRDVLDNQSKEEVQNVLDDLNTDNAKSKDEARRLRRALQAKETEALAYKQRLEELETVLREVLNDPGGTRQTLVNDIEKLQRDLETTMNALDRTKIDIADKDRLLRHRDGLLESTSLESRRLSELLDKERASRKHDLDQFERAQRGQVSHIRTMAQQESRVLELETAYSQDKRKMLGLENQYREQLLERNSLLLALWNRLSTICGGPWGQEHSLVNGEVPSVEVISRSLPGFNRNIILAVKTIEGIIGTFKVRIRGIEKDLWKDFQTLEHGLDMRIKRMDSLERAVRDAQDRQAQLQADVEREAREAQARPQANRTFSTKSVKGSEEIGRLKSEAKLLKAELKFHRQHPSPMAQQMLNQQQQQLNPEQALRQSSGGSQKAPSPARAIMQGLLRHHSTSAVEQLQSTSQPTDEQATLEYQMLRARQQPIVLSTPPIQPSEQRWIHRLKELERRLKAEREARLLDRRGARQRLEEGRVENEELRLMLEREKTRRESLTDVADSIAGSERLGVVGSESESRGTFLD